MLIANLTNAPKILKDKGFTYTLRISNVGGGVYVPEINLPVADKREARTVAASHGAKPWNF